MVVVVLSNAGDQIPVIPLLDVVGKAAKTLLGHIGATFGNVGTIVNGNTCIVIVTTPAHTPGVGVNV